MFKIRTLQFKDFEKLENLENDFPDIKRINKNKLLPILQPLIPHYFRTIPSIHLAFEKDNLLGFVIIESVCKLNNSWQINQIFVQDEIRKEGLGEELLKYVLSVYGGHGVEYFLCEVNSQNFSALSLFHKCGFRRYAKVHFYKKEIDKNSLKENITLDSDFTIRPQCKTDFGELEKLDLSIIPPDLRPALGRSKNYFKEKKNAYVLINNSRNIIIGWFELHTENQNEQFIELIISPGWTHLYEALLNTIIVDCININNEFSLTVKVIDYNTELTNILSKLEFLSFEVRELLVKTLWLKVKRKKSERRVIVTSTQPIRGSS